MRTVLREAVPLSVLITALLCPMGACKHSSAADSTPHFPFAYVQEDCGPADGLVTEFYFTAKQAQGGKYKEPFLRIEVNENLPKSALQSYSVKPGTSAVYVSRCLGQGSCEPPISGFLRLSKFKEGVGASGDYELRFRDGSFEKGRFDATWYQHYFLCG